MAETKDKTIAVLTSGGDSQGMNAAVMQTVFTAEKLGYRVLGVKYGYRGIQDDTYIVLNSQNVREYVHRGGTKLYSARFKEFKKPEVVRACAQKLMAKNIMGLVVIGGDGSFRGAKDLCKEDVPSIGVPGTIDNDINATDYTIGFDSACNIVVNNIYMLRDTMESHSRADIVEVMGRYCGDIAVYASVAAGADAVIVPETFDTEPYEGKPEQLKNALKELIKAELLRGQAEGKASQIIVIAEGVCMNADGDIVVNTLQLADEIKKETKIDTRGTVLGHIQRGGNPTMFDRTLACKMADYAVRLLDAGESKKIVSIRENKIVHDDIDVALGMPRRFDLNIYDIAPLLFHGTNLKYTRK